MTATLAPSTTALPNTLPPPVEFLHNKRAEPRRDVDGDLWMIDHHGCTVLRCRVVDASANGIKLCVPLGYGVAEGQRYELRSHLPGANSRPVLGLVGARWGTVVRTNLCVGQGEDHLEVGLVLDAADFSSLRVVGSF